MSRDHEDGCATGQSQGVGSEAYLNVTSQGPTPEDARKDGHISGRSRRFMEYSGWGPRSIPKTKIDSVYPATAELVWQELAIRW
jgi:hypothetical protein